MKRSNHFKYLKLFSILSLSLCVVLLSQNCGSSFSSSVEGDFNSSLTLFDEKTFIEGINVGQVNLGDLGLSSTEANLMLAKCKSDTSSWSIYSKFLGIGPSGTLYALSIDFCSDIPPGVILNLYDKDSSSTPKQIIALEGQPISIPVEVGLPIYIYRYSFADLDFQPFFSLQSSSSRLDTKVDITDPAHKKSFWVSPNSRLSATPLLKLSILKPLKSMTITAETSLTKGQFCVLAFGEHLSYVWKKDGVVDSNAIKPCYLVDKLALSDAGAYTVTIKDSVGDEIEQSAQLTVTAKPIAPAISAQLPSLTVAEGDSVSSDMFCITSTGTEPLEYRWFLNGKLAPFSQNSQCYIIPAAKINDGGSYVVEVTNSAGAASSTNELIVQELVAPSYCPAGTKTISSSDGLNSCRFDWIKGPIGASVNYTSTGSPKGVATGSCQTNLTWSNAFTCPNSNISYQFTFNNEVWQIPDDMDCDSFGYTYYSKQAVGVVALRESRRIRITIPTGALNVLFTVKSHASKPSIVFTKSNYVAICYKSDPAQCPANELTVEPNGAGDSLVPRLGANVQKQFSLDPTDQNLYLYQLNREDPDNPGYTANLGTSSMFGASVSFKMTPEECVRRAQ